MNNLKTPLEKAIIELKNDGVVAIPTETVYGLAANAFRETAVKKIFELKKRPLNNPLIVHLYSVDGLEEIADEIPDAASKLARHFWPGPLTLVLKKKNVIPDIVSAGLETVAVRIPDHPYTLELLEKLSFPLAAPSANPFGSISPTNPEHVRTYFKDDIDFILDGGVCERGVESTIVAFDMKGQPVLLRHGSISLEEIESVVGDVKVSTHEEHKPQASGMLSRHYSPSTPSYMTENVKKAIEMFSGKQIGLLMFKHEVKNHNGIFQEVLSRSGDFSEAARNLYAAMHRLDKLNVDLLIFEELPDINLGTTINDKLSRAAKTRI